MFAPAANLGIGFDRRGISFLDTTHAPAFQLSKSSGSRIYVRCDALNDPVRVFGAEQVRRCDQTESGVGAKPGVL